MSMSEINPHHREQEQEQDRADRPGAVAGLDAPQAEPEHRVASGSLPDRFLDAASGEVRTDVLIEAYLDLERQLEAQPRRATPSSPEDYAINIAGDAFSVDAEVNRKLHEAGFDQDQAQLVYDLAASHLLPMVTEVAADYEAKHQVERLSQDFGGEDQWREVSRQIRVWGESNLTADAFAVLASTREGVLAMHKMMSGSEPVLSGHASLVQSSPTEADLKQMMRDPRYWRDQDRSFVEQVREGFRRLYDQ